MAARAINRKKLKPTSPAKPVDEFKTTISAEVSWVTLYQLCSDRSAPLNKMVARAKNGKTLKHFFRKPVEGY